MQHYTMGKHNFFFLEGGGEGAHQILSQYLDVFKKSCNVKIIFILISYDTDLLFNWTVGLKFQQIIYNSQLLNL